ncbi:MAG: hypothetical protein JNM97_14390 [Rhodoferax sp.]|nr:hypothetical protein [Rhodoferax sp.]
MPLRGIAADAMAITMALSMPDWAPATSLQAIAPQAAPVQHADCEEHAVIADASAAPADDPVVAADDNCPTCASCMVCSSAALAVQESVPPSLSLPHALPPSAGEAFHSAAARRGFKPPIS